MDGNTELELVFSDESALRRAKAMAETIAFVYFQNKFRFLPFDDMEPQNADGWIHYPARYVCWERIDAFRSLWSDYRLFHRRYRDMRHDDEVRQYLGRIERDGRRLVFHEADFSQNLQIEHHYYEDFFSILCFLLASVWPETHFEGMCRSVEGYAKRVLTRAVWDGAALRFEQMEGDPVYAAIVVEWTASEGRFVKRSLSFPFIRVDFLTDDCDAVERDEALGQWLRRVNDVKTQMVSARLRFQHASFPHVMIEAPSRDVCVRYRDELLRLAAERGWKTQLFSILHAKECSGPRVVIPDSVTKIGDDAFRGCTSLQRVVIPDSVTEIGEKAFEDCSALEELRIPDSVVKIGDFAFHSCTSLRTVTLPKRLRKLGTGLFCDCAALEEVHIPPRVNRVERYAFSRCEGLKSVNIPEKMRRIDDEAFKQCSSLRDIVIPGGVSTIGKDVFRKCSSALVIHGETGSTAERCAQEHGLTFEALRPGDDSETEANYEKRCGSTD